MNTNSMIKNSIKRMGKPIVHAVTGTRKFYYDKLSEVGASATGKRVLEIGSGRQDTGENSYSALHLFTDTAEFRQTDKNGDFGHEALDITTMDIESEYDIILCLNVLEHVFDTATAVANLRRALVPGGMLYVAVPFMFPLHDEPHDYWRFTEHALRQTMAEFALVDVSHKGLRSLPFGLFVSAQR